jgi:heme exporter protein D
MGPLGRPRYRWEDREIGGEVWAWFVWLTFVITVMNLRFYKMLGIY